MHTGGVPRRTAFALGVLLLTGLSAAPSARVAWALGNEPQSATRLAVFGAPAPGGTFTVVGLGFAPGEAVQCSILYQAGGPGLSTTTSSFSAGPDGTFFGEIRVPAGVNAGS